MPLLLLQSPPHTPLPSPLHCCCHPRYQVPARLPSHWVSRASFETLQRPSVDGSGNSARQLGRPPRLLSTTSLPTLKTQQLHSLQPLTPVPERYDPALGRASPGPRSQASAIMRGKVARRSATSSAVGGSGSSGGGGGSGSSRGAGESGELSVRERLRSRLGSSASFGPFMMSSSWGRKGKAKVGAEAGVVAGAGVGAGVGPGAGVGGSTKSLTSSEPGNADAE